MEKLSESERKAHKELKERVKDCESYLYQEDERLLQWLVARRFNVDKAEEMIRNDVKWRKENNVDNILDWKIPEVIEKYTAFAEIGYDFNGGPIYYLMHRNFDIRGLLHSVSKQDYLRYQIYIGEKSREAQVKQSKLLGRPVTQHSFLMDMERFNVGDCLWKPGMDISAEAQKMFEDHYPEIINVALIINVPKIFHVIWSMFKPLMDERTISKMQIFGKDGWQEAILAQLPAEVVPKCYGGTRVDPDGDPNCPSITNKGGKIPESYFIANRFSKSIDKSTMKILNVAKGSTQVLDFQITIPNSKIKWEFITDDYDIEFGLDFKEGNLDPIVLFQHTRVNSHLAVEIGEILCEKKGTYILTFDNVYSYLRAKKVHYNVEIIGPSQLPKE